MLWCHTCEFGWLSTAGRECWECGAEGDSRVDLVTACLHSTGLAAEGQAYLKAHPGWVAP